MLARRRWDGDDSDTVREHLRRKVTQVVQPKATDPLVGIGVERTVHATTSYLDLGVDSVS
jgi:hypothetical protein